MVEANIWMFYCLSQLRKSRSSLTVIEVPNWKSLVINDKHMHTLFQFALNHRPDASFTTGVAKDESGVTSSGP